MREDRRAVDEERRNTLKALIIGGIAFIFPAPVLNAILQSVSSIRSSASKSPPPIPGYNWLEHLWGFAVDINKCIGCGRCIAACKTENDVPRGEMYARTWVERYTIIEGETPEDREIVVDVISDPEEKFENRPDLEDKPIVRSFFVPKLCNHCAIPPCVRVCPVGATFMTKDGVVLVDKEWCIGCRYCIVTCPYGARYLDPRTGTADKCTWCYHRITKGLNPACVEACPTNARVFGDLKDPESPVSRLLKEAIYNVLKPYYNTKPKVYYVNGLPEEVR